MNTPLSFLIIALIPIVAFVVIAYKMGYRHGGIEKINRQIKSYQKKQYLVIIREGCSTRVNIFVSSDILDIEQRLIDFWNETRSSEPHSISWTRDREMAILDEFSGFTTSDVLIRMASVRLGATIYSVSIVPFDPIEFKSFSSR